MPVAAKVELLERDFALSVSGTEADRSAAIATFARQALAEADATNTATAGHPVPHTTLVDGRQTEDLDTVKPDGTIIFDFGLDLQNDVIQWIYDQLRLHAPVRSGRFRSSITVYADGQEVQPGTKAPDAQDWIFLALVPYARKIEGGRKPPQSKQAPNGVFEVVAAMAAARFGNIAKVRFTYQNPIGGASDLETWAAKHSAAMEGHKAQRRQYDKDTRQPAVLVSFR